MSITRKTDYAFRMLAMLAQTEGLLSVRTAAEANDIPYSFARSIQHGLVQAGIIDSLRGVHGGMRLAVAPEELPLSRIIDAVQGPIFFNACCDPAFGCDRRGGCQFHRLWLGTQSVINDYLSSVTLADVINEQVAPHVSERYTQPEAFSSYVAEQSEAFDLSCPHMVN